MQPPSSRIEVSKTFNTMNQFIESQKGRLKGRFKDY